MTDPAQKVLYTCSAHSIQGYLFGDEKLQAVVGASLLVEKLPECLIKSATTLFGESAFEVINKAAGMVGLLFNNDADARRFARIAPVLLHRHAPGLGFTQTVTTIKDEKLGAALDQAAQARRAQRNLPPTPLPEATGALEKCRRTGEPVCRSTEKDGPTSATSHAKIECLRVDEGTLGLLRKLLPEEEGILRNAILHSRWPQNFDQFTQSEGEYLAVVHADVNGLGKLVKEFLSGPNLKGDLDTAIDSYKDFSQGLTNCAVNALQAALEDLIKKYGDTETIPFRPLVAAGDDVTYVIHARDAFSFTETILQKLRSEAETLFSDLGIKENLLSTAAGIAFVKPHYPFSRAYELAESLCRYTKRTTQRDYSALAFHRLTTSLIDDYPSFIEKGMTTPNKTVLTMNPYAIEETAPSGRASLKDLENLAEACKNLPRGKLRGFIETLRNRASFSERDWNRLFEVAREKNYDDLKCFTEALVPFGIGNGSVDPPPPWKDESGETPLFDTLEWQTLNESENAAQTTTESYTS